MNRRAQRTRVTSQRRRGGALVCARGNIYERLKRIRVGRVETSPRDDKLRACVLL